MNKFQLVTKAGKLLHKSKNYLEAYSELLKTIEYEECESLNYALLGDSCWKLGKVTESILYYTNALLSNNINEETINMTNCFLNQIGKNSQTKILNEKLAKISKINSTSRKNNLLAVYDLTTQPYSVGDLIAFQYGALTKLSQNQNNLIDFCFICDIEEKPICHIFSKMMENNNRIHNLFNLIQIIQFNDKINSIHIFGSHNEFYEYINKNEYNIWPEIKKIRNKKYTYYEIFEIVTEYYKLHKKIPKLTIPDALQKWLSNFMQINVRNQIPVTVNIRNNPTFHQDRNSNIANWLTFFDYCNNRYPVKFIIICSRSEITPSMRCYPNVIIAKDYHTSLEHDITLIINSAFHLGTASGPITIPFFSDKPYAAFNSKDIITNINSYNKTIKILSKSIARCAFSNNLQNIILEDDSFDNIKNEFEKIWFSLNINITKIHKCTIKNDNSHLHWLT